jgi:hypothetical protein
MADSAECAFATPAHSSAPLAGLRKQEVITIVRFAPTLPGNWRGERFEDEFGASGVMLTPGWNEDFVLVLFRQGGFVNFAVLVDDDYEFIAAAENVEALFQTVAGVIERHRETLLAVGDSLN